jgi:hypothetical protein
VDPGTYLDPHVPQLQSYSPESSSADGSAPLRVAGVARPTCAGGSLNARACYKSQLLPDALTRCCHPLRISCRD